MAARATRGPVRFSTAERWVIAACAISMLIVQMDWFALNLAIPAIARDFKEASTDLHWVISGYMIAIGAVMVTGGHLADIFGRRRIIVCGLAIFGLLSIACGASPNASWLIPARVVQGLGAALIFPVSIAVASSVFSGVRQSRAIGIVLGFAAIGTAIGPFVGGAFSEFWTWRGVFLINVPFCIAAIVLMLRFVEESRNEGADRHIDLLGVVTITGGLVCISLAFDRGEAWGWLSPATLGTLIGGVVLIGAFIGIESRVRSPLVDLGLFRNRIFDAIVIGGSLSNVVYCLVAVFSALYLQQARGFSPFQSGLIFLALSAGSGSASYFSGKLAERFPAARLMASGMLVAAAGIVGLTSVESLWLYVPLFLLTGAGVGLAWALANVATQAAVKPSEAGEASGVTLTCLVMLGAVSVAIAAAMLELLSGSVAGAASDAPALNIILRAGAALSLGGAVVLIGLGRPRAQVQPSVDQRTLEAAQ
jgi:EmrB/QacA subfamily drug resistance transporter